MKKFAVLASACLATLAACTDSTAPIDREQSVRGSYIVTVADGVDPKVVAQDHGVVPHYIYTDALHGFAAFMSDATLQTVLTDTRVREVEADEIDTEQTTQTGATWGIDRVDQRTNPPSGTYSYISNGSGATVYIIDTGILLTHQDFGGRAIWGFNAVNTVNTDCNGHGTHVASTVGGATYGIAKGVRLVAVKVLDCNGSGTNSSVIAGIDWVTKNHAANAVANVSLGGGVSQLLDDAVARSIASGVTYVFAAGNYNANACNSSPGRVPDGITVGASSSTDAKASFSDYGTCLDMFAPGVSITAAWIGSNTAVNTISGTSMAAPHVAGVAALYLATHSGATPQQVRDALVANATSGLVLNAGTGSPNLLLFSNY